MKNEIRKKKPKEQKKCKYPMSQFYIYEDDVPEGTRVSTIKDCIECDDIEFCQDATHCLIQEPIHSSYPRPHPNPDE